MVIKNIINRTQKINNKLCINNVEKYPNLFYFRK